MLKVVCSNNSAIFRELRSPAFQALDLKQITVTTGTEALVAARREHPALVVLDVDLAEKSGYEVCAAIKADPELKDTRVILVITGSPSTAEVERLAESGCDDIMTIPVADDLYSHAARLLSLPQRQRSQVRAQIMLPVGSTTPVLRGEATTITLDSLELSVEQKVDVGVELKVRLQRSGSTQAVIVKGKVLACEGRKADTGLTLRVKLVDLRPEDEQALADLALWEVTERPNGMVVTLRGDITERTDFAGLRAQLKGTDVSFNLGAIRYLNSTGIRRWVEFLDSIDAETSYSFVRCSLAFVSQLGMVPRAIGRGKMVSFFAPYRCDVCERDTEQLLQTQAMVVPVGKTLPESPPFDCTQCGAKMVLDDLPERFFAFMQRAG